MTKWTRGRTLAIGIALIALWLAWETR